MKLGNFTWREVRSRPARAILTLLSVVLGVASVVSVLISTRATRRAYQAMFQAMAGRADLEIAAVDSGSFNEADVLPWLTDVPGVRAVSPLVQQRTNIYFDNDQQRVTATVLGIDPDSDKEFRDFDLQEGHFFYQGGGILLEASFARNLSPPLKVGDSVYLLTRAGRPEATVVGLLEAKGAAAFTQGGLLLMPLRTAQAQFFKGRAKQLTSIHVMLTPEARRDQVIAAIQKRLTDDQVEGLIVRPPVARTQLAEETQLSTELGLKFATGLSLVVSVFIILNTFLMNLGERRRQFGILRAIGATRRQIGGLLIVEALIMGVIGTVLGIGLGLVGAYFLGQGMSKLSRSPAPAFDLSLWPFVWGALFGMGVSLAGTIYPAFKAGRVSPLEGMSHLSREDREGFPLPHTILGALIVLICGTLIGLCIFGRLPMNFSVTPTIVLLIGIALLLPLAVGVLLPLVARVLHPMVGFECTLAQRQLLRRKTRTALTIGVLFVAISTGVGLGSSVLDNVHDVREWYQRTIAGDFIVRAMMPDFSSVETADMPEAIEGQLRAIDGIRTLEQLRLFKTEVSAPQSSHDPGALTPHTEQAIVICREFPPEEHLHLDLVDAEAEDVRRGLDDGGIVLGTVLANRLKLRPGDHLAIVSRKSPEPVPLPIVGLTNEYLAGGLAFYIRRDTARLLFDIEGADAYVIQVQPGQGAAVETQLKAICHEHGLLLQSFRDLAQMIDGMMSGVVSGLWVLLALGFVVAAFGIANTLTMNVLEQTRELGLLRIVAMTARQVRRTILSQAALIGLVGIVPGVLAGILLAWLISLATMPGIGHPVEFSFHPILTGTSLLTAFLIVVAAAWAPAERAARLELIRALQYD